MILRYLELSGEYCWSVLGFDDDVMESLDIFYGDKEFDGLSVDICIAHYM